MPIHRQDNLPIHQQTHSQSSPTLDELFVTQTQADSTLVQTLSIMTQVEQMQNPSENAQMFPTDSGGVKDPASEIHVDSYWSPDPTHGFLEDYRRSMLAYTQRQMSTFVDVDDSHLGSGTRSRSSQSSGHSGQSSHSNENTASGEARNANGPPPSAHTTAGGSKNCDHDMASG